MASHIERRKFLATLGGAAAPRVADADRQGARIDSTGRLPGGRRRGDRMRMRLVNQWRITCQRSF